MTKLSAIDIANYFLILIKREDGDSITHLKLQKLLYFAQKLSLGVSNKLLFSEEMMAWPYGPVTLSVYHEFKVFNNNAIPLPPEMDFDIYDQYTKNIVYKTHLKYGEHSASYLLNLSHEDSAWKKAYISTDRIIEYSVIAQDNKAVDVKTEIILSENDNKYLVEMEDEWRMNYDCGEPSEDITERLIEDLNLLDIKIQNKIRQLSLDKRW